MRSWDTETGLIQGGLLAPPLSCLTFADEVDRPQLIHWQDPACKKEVITTLERPNCGANVGYDLAVVSAQWPDLLPLCFESLQKGFVGDVLIRQKLLDIGEGVYRSMVDEEASEIAGEEVRRSIRYSLADLTQRHLDVTLDKDAFRLQYGKLRTLPLKSWPEGARRYPLDDAKYTLAVWQAQNEMKLRAPVSLYLVDEAPQVRSAFALQLISCWGFKTDPVAVQKFLSQLEVEQEIRYRDLVKGGLVRVDGSRNQKLAIQRMRQVAGDSCALTPKGLEEYRGWWRQMARLGKLTPETRLRQKRQYFDKGYVSLKGENCRATKDDLLMAYGSYGQFQTLYTKVSKLLANKHLPVQTGFEVLLETGRTSSSASKLIPNSLAIQNLPRQKGMRECFQAREGCVIIACDFGMAELVSLAQLAYTLFGASRLRDVLNEGKDPHLTMAGQLSGWVYAKLVEARKSKKKVVNLMGQWFTVKELRQLCKALSFGLPGGLGAETFVEYARMGYGVTVPLEHFHNLKGSYLKQWPEMPLYFNRISKMCDNPEGLCDVQQFMSGRLRGRIPYTVACNTGFQGLTADGAKAALFEVVRRCYVEKSSALYGCRVVNFVHDEILLEAPIFKARAAAKELEAVMCSIYQKYTPDVLITAEASMMYRWSKDASDPVYDGDGELIPYEDAPRKAV